MPDLLSHDHLSLMQNFVSLINLIAYENLRWLSPLQAALGFDSCPWRRIPTCSPSGSSMLIHMSSPFNSSNHIAARIASPGLKMLCKVQLISYNLFVRVILQVIAGVAAVDSHNILAFLCVWQKVRSKTADVSFRISCFQICFCQVCWPLISTSIDLWHWDSRQPCKFKFSNLQKLSLTFFAKLMRHT